MSHITIIIERALPTGSAAEEVRPISAHVKWSPPDDMTDAEIGQAVRRLYKQIRDLGDGVRA